MVLTRFRIAALGAIAVFSLAAQAVAADVSVRLKPSVVVNGADIRLGDLFDGAGDAGMAVFGMAPGPGRMMAYSASYVQAKAKQAGHIWDNSENIATVTIARGGSAAASPSDSATVKFAQSNAADPFAPPANASKSPAPAQRAAGAAADLKRGDSVQIVYRAPGIELIAAGKATADASIGGKARAVNLRSNKAVDGVLVSSSRIEAYSLAGSATQVALLDNSAQ